MNIALIEELASQVQDQGFITKIKGNEAQTRQCLIDRTLEALGYDTRNPKICVVEGNADYQGKGGKKVDYSLYKNDALILIAEAKPFEDDLEKPDTIKQLSQYFSNIRGGNPDCKFFAMLTNGIEYRFFSDLDSLNMLDKKPFFVFNLKDYSSEDIKTLQMFSYDKIDDEKIWEWGKILRTIENNVINLSPDFARFVIEKSQLPIKQINKNKVQEYTPEIKKVFEYLNSKVCADKSIGKKTQSQKLDKNLSSAQKGNVQAFWEKGITEVLSSSSTPLLAEEIWEKIQKRYSKNEIPTTNSNPVKRVSEQCLYMLENIQSIGKNPSRYALKTNAWTEEEILQRVDTAIKEMYQNIKTEILKLGNITANVTKNYISFKTNNKNFVGFIFQQSKIRVFFTPRVDEFSDPSKKLIDTYGKNTGNGNTEFIYESPEDKNYLLSLIKQSYDKCKAS